MRVISGRYKKRHFDIPTSFKARPTTDFAKENLFNVLTNYLDFEGLTALDLFSGTGSISIELVSRGCSKVISVEKDSRHHAFICKIMREVQTDACIPLRTDVFRFIDRCNETFDFVCNDAVDGRGNATFRRAGRRALRKTAYTAGEECDYADRRRYGSCPYHVPDARRGL